MALKKSLVEVTHDEGYGDSLLMHINLAFGGKDMRADKIVNTVASAVQVEGIPEGWEFVRVGKVFYGEHWVNNGGWPQQWDSVTESTSKNYVIIRKIEKQKQYRPFANAAEFEPHRDKWLKLKSRADHRIKTHSYNDRKHYTGDVGDTWQTMFAEYEFEDGTPFGVEVTE